MTEERAPEEFDIPIEDEATAPPIDAKNDGAPRILSPLTPAEGTPAVPKSVPPDRPSKSPSSRTDLSPSARRVRARLTLRIPDDEISRPTPPAAPVEPVHDSNGQILATRIISIEPNASAANAAADPSAGAPSSKAPPTVVMPETPEDESWTPYQSTVAESVAEAAPTTRVLPTSGDPRAADSGRDDGSVPDVAGARIPPAVESDAAATGEYPSPISEEIPVVPDSAESGERLDMSDAVPSSRPTPAKPANFIDTPTLPQPAVAMKAPSAPHVPIAPAAPSAPLAHAAPVAHAAHAAPVAATVPRPPMRAVLQTDPDGEDVRFDEEDGAPTVSEPTRPMPSGRGGDPSDLPEIAPEDLVSVESVPKVVPSSPYVAPSSPAVTPAAATSSAAVTGPTPAMRSKAKSIPPPAPPSSPPPKQPAAPHVAAAAPSAQAAQAAPAAPTAPIPPQTLITSNPSQGTSSRQSNRVIVPNSTPSALAPPAMTEAAAARKRTRPWWEELFNDDFIRTMAKITDQQIADEASFIEESLGVAPGAMVLDLACGTGRHAIELTRRGYKVVGFDLSLAMLARAADEAYDRTQKLNFVQGDMREMTFESTFDGVYCWNTSFGFFEEEKNAQVVQRVHKSLRPGGQFLLDVVNRDYIMRQSPSLAWFEGDGCICMDEMQIDWITSRMRTKRTMMMDDGRTKEIEYSIRVYALHELGKLLHDNGFKVVEVSGRASTPGVFFGGESPRTLILAEKR